MKAKAIAAATALVMSLPLHVQSHGVVQDGHDSAKLTWRAERASFMPHDRNLPKPNAKPDEYVVVLANLWSLGQTIRVCFHGGDVQLRQRIIDIGSQWFNHVNLRLDADSKRDCQAGDASEIRIGFTEPGLWSYIGTDSMHPELVAKSLSSMNFGGWDFQALDEPAFTGIVLHEFGHALGFHHEHQSPGTKCDDEYNWPKLYAWYEKQYSWSKDKVDQNVRQLMNDVSAFEWSERDAGSIMVYRSNSEFLHKGAASKCNFRENYQLSDLDKQGAQRSYPTKGSAQQERIDKLRRQIAMTSNPQVREALARQLQAVEQPPELQSFVWQSRNIDLNGLSGEFGQLYTALLDGTREGIGVETYVYRGDTTRSLESIIRSESLVAGKYFPKAVDLFICHLNPSICKITTGKGMERYARWSNRPEDEIQLPMLTFEPVIVHRDHRKTPEQRLDTIVVGVTGGCAQYDSDCRKYVANLNRVPIEVLEGDYDGFVLVPALAYRTRVTFINRPARSSSATPQAAASAVRNVLQKRPEVVRSIVPEVQLRMQQNDGSKPPEGTREKVLELISHPFARKAEIPNGRILVGVLDTWLDSSHCDISTAVRSYIDAGERPPGVVSGEPCGTAGKASEPFDHGTHVVGLIAGSRTGKAGPGINPNAQVYFLRINPQQMKSDNAAYLNYVSERLNSIYKEDRPEVVNLSFQYPFPQGLNDTFLSAIAHNRQLTLFVASAGNLNQELSSNGVCAVRPACGGATNLMTVAALDLSGPKPALDSSNFGTAVHIGAPGKSIVSTLSGGRIGPMSGTSQAAPLVSGAASLLLMKNPRLYPEQVKNRLIYTSDLYPSLYKQMQGGRLNVERALAFDSAQLTLDTAAPQLHGDVINAESSIALTDVQTRKPLNPLWSQIRRLKFEKELGYYTMFWKPRPDAPLTRAFVTPQNDKQKLVLRSEQTVPQLKTYNLSRIDDYVAAIAASTD